MSIRTFLPLAALAAAFLLVACDGDDDDAVEPTQAATNTQAPGGGTATTPPDEVASPTPGPFVGTVDPVTVAAPANLGPVVLREVRAASHEGFDRIVFEFDGDKVPGYSIKYADAAVACGSGIDQTEFIGGGTAPAAMLLVDIRPSDAHDGSGVATAVRDLSPRLDTIKRAFRICDFEAVVVYAVALSGEEPFKVSTLQGPARLVIDIAQ